MAYITYDELKSNLAEKTIIQLTDDDRLGVADMAKVAQAMAKSQAEADGYCVVKYPTKVPFADGAVPEVVKTAVIDITIYRLFCLRENIPEARQTQYRNAVATLDKIAQGKLGLGIPNENAPAPSQGVVRSSAPERIFSSDRLEGY